MGTYSALMASLRCARCGGAFVDEIQFYGPADREMPVYQEGQRVGELTADAPYEGIAPAYDPVCMRAWLAAEATASFEALAIDVERGDVMVWHQGKTSRASAGDVRDVAARTSPRSIGWCTFAAMLADGGLVIGDAAGIPMHGGPWWESHGAAVAAALVAGGWMSSSSVDLAVVVDEQGRLRPATRPG